MIIRQPGQFLHERLRRFWRWMAVAAAVSTVICILGWVLIGRRTPLWMALALVPLAAGIAFWRDKETRSWLRRNRQGLHGEEQVGAVLDTQLGGEFRVLHDRDKTWGNVDHVVIGPTGVFAIETKAWTGYVHSARDGRLKVGGRYEEKTITQATVGALWVRNLLAKADMDMYVEALVVLTLTALSSGPIRRRQVRVLTIDDLVSEILGGCRALTSDQIARGANVIFRAGAPVEVRSMMFEDR